MMDMTVYSQAGMIILLLTLVFDVEFSKLLEGRARKPPLCKAS